MPKNQENGGGDVPSGSESSTDATYFGLRTEWQWEGDGSNWTTYSKKLSTEISKALTSKKQKVTVETGNQTKFQVLFDKLVQKNSSTGWERRVRCCFVDGANVYCWQWMDENGKWNAYPPNIAVLLENGRGTADATVEFSIQRRQYVVDLSKMEQSNKSTAVIRKVERTTCGAVSDEESPTGSPTAGDDASLDADVDSAGDAKPRVATRSASGVKRKAAAAAAAAASEDDDDDDEDDELSAKKAKQMKKSGKSGARVKEEPVDTVKTVVVKGRAPVDPECGIHSTHHVYHEGSDIYDVMLNQTNVGNNNNKFYLIQLLEDDNRKQFSVWFRWGRVGFKGQSSLTRCGSDLDQAKKLFCQKFTDKTKNDFSSRKNFQKVPGKYDMLAIDYSSKTEETEVKKTAKPAAVPESKLAKEIQALIKLICDIKEMEDAVIEMKYDTKKAPLGRLTADQIKAGYVALKKIDALIGKNDFGQKLTEACNDFYTRIPHDFRMSRPPIIRTKEDVKEKIKLLEALGDIEIALRILKESKSTENPIDAQYASLRCSLQLMDKKDPTYKIIGDYLLNTHAATHNQYKMKLLNVFCADREGEQKKFKDVGNRMLLWHGSRLTNLVGIMSQGLRIAPPEAPVTGYMFGKGIYFANMSSKSANYCFATQSRNVGLILLCEVSLGQINELLSADYDASELPKGKNSVKGAGKIAPDPAQNVTLPGGTIVPLGKPKDTGLTNPSGYTLNYDEFIVYDAAQVKMKYFVQVEFDFS